MKKIISIFISLALVLSMMPNIVLAAPTTLSPIIASADCLADGENPSKNGNVVDGDTRMRIYTNVDKSATSNRGILYYTFQIPDIPQGQTITNASFKLWIKFAQPSNASFRLRFYKVDANSWSEDTLTWNNQPLAIATAADVGETAPPYTYTAYPKASPDMEFAITGVNDRIEYTFDIAPMIRNFLASGNSQDRKFSFAVTPWICPNGAPYTSNLYMWVVHRDAKDIEQRPALTLTTDEVQAFSVTTVTPEDGTTVSDNSDVTFNFNNTVDSSSVSGEDFNVTNLNGEKIDITDNDITVSGSTITLSKTWNAYDFYRVSISGVSDMYGQSLSGSYTTSFDVSDESTSSNAASLPVFGIYTKGITNIHENDSGKVYGKERYVLYKFDLSSVDSSASVINAEFKWTSQRDGKTTIKVRQVPNGSWTDRVSLDKDLGSDGYFELLDAAMKSDACIVDEIEHNFGSSYSIKTHTADVSAAVSKALYSNESPKYITFAFTDTSTHNFYNNLSTTNSAYRPKLTVTQGTPSFNAITASPSKGGFMDGVCSPIEVNLATVIADGYASSDYIELINVSSDTAADVDIKVAGSKLTVTPLVDLNERSEYKLVLKSGIKDVFDNVLSADKIISRFTTGTALEFYDIKFTSDASPIYDSMSEITSYLSGSEVTAVAKVDNKSGSDLDAIMIIALYDSDNSLITVNAVGGPFSAPKNQTTQYAKTISVPSNASGTYIKAFIWNDLEHIRPIYGDEVINQAK